MPYNTSHTTNTHKPQNQTQKKMLASTMQHSTHHHTPTRKTRTRAVPERKATADAELASVSANRAPHHPPGQCGPLAPLRVQALLRKEVIQPHLPVRLPCYDFVLIASPTFDGSLPQGVRPPASGVTNFRDLTGGVYKARERIHRSVADLRLLATPTSWGRVADPNPN